MTVLRALLLVALAFGSVSFAEDAPPYANNADYKALLSDELKLFNRLLSEALEEDYRRQAIYLARRVVELKADDERAQGVLTQWSGADFDVPAPKGKYVSKLEGVMLGLGKRYEKFANRLRQAGVDELTYYPLGIRARQYGNEIAEWIQSMREAGQMWLGTFSHFSLSDVKDVLGQAMYEVEWPSAWDDDYLRVNVHWPECKVATLRKWRLITDCKTRDAVKILRGLDELERYVLDRLGGKTPKKGESTNVVVCSKGETYETLVAVLLHERSAERANKHSAYHSRWRRVALACWKHRDNDFIEGERLALGAASRALVRTHLATGGGSVRGKGAWLLTGLAGAMEALDWSDPGFTHVNPELSWRLAVAKALQADGKLMDWERFLDLDDAKAELVERTTVTVKIKGESRKMKNVDVVAAQATAFVIGLLTADPKRAPKRLGKLIGALVKRDSLPNIDKAMGWKKGRALKEVERILSDGTPSAPRK